MVFFSQQVSNFSAICFWWDDHSSSDKMNSPVKILSIWKSSFSEYDVSIPLWRNHREKQIDDTCSLDPPLVLVTLSYTTFTGPLLTISVHNGKYRALLKHDMCFGISCCNKILLAFAFSHYYFYPILSLFFSLWQLNHLSICPPITYMNYCLTNRYKR